MPYYKNDRIKRIVQIDPLVILGAVYLSFIAGFVNAISLSYYNVPISHMTGAVSRLSIDAASGDFSEFRNIFFIIFGFFLGAIFSGLIIGAQKFKPSIEYSLLLIIESVLLSASFFLFKSNLKFALFFVAFACGQQNAMASNYLGLIIRTTHLTGIVTDLGVLIGQSIKHKRPNLWKIYFLLSILTGFFGGGLCGVYLFHFLNFYSIFIPSSMCFFAGVGFYYLRLKVRSVNKNNRSLKL